MGRLKYSVVIETANMHEHMYEESDGVQFFERGLREVLHQSSILGNPEIIVVDTMPNDDVKNLLKKYPHVKRFPFRLGEYFACKNYGFKKSVGDVVIFFDSDCIWLPGFAQAVKDTFENHPEISICCGLTHYPLHLRGKAHTVVDFVPTGKFGRIRVAVANNLAVRRDAFKKYLFKEGLPRTRAAVALFSFQVWKDKQLYRNPAMEQIHRYHHKWVPRRLQVGYDAIAARKLEAGYPQSSWVKNIGIFFPFVWWPARVMKDLKNAVRARQILNIRLIEWPFMFIIIAGCRLFETVGMLIGLVYPQYFTRKYEA
ncbi:MAG: glycosyltransferase [Candidatus Woesearchaeota archaeon]